jgi:hypothetical protein
MDFPDLGAAVEAPKRERMPPRKKQSSAAGGERRPKSALQSMVEGRSELPNGTASGRVHDWIRAVLPSPGGLVWRSLACAGPQRCLAFRRVTHGGISHTS